MTFVCQFVCLLAGLLKKFVWIFVKFGEQVDYESEKSWINFGGPGTWGLV